MKHNISELPKMRDSIFAIAKIEIAYMMVNIVGGQNDKQTHNQI